VTTFDVSCGGVNADPNILVSKSFLPTGANNIIS
jgi:hypothetical protein